jgi:phage terminase small subunit
MGKTNAVLDPREQRFVDLYIARPNATRAYLAAGFECTVKSAGTMATRLLNKTRIQDAVAKRQAQLAQRYEVTPEAIIAEFAKIAFGNTADFVVINDDGTLSVDFTGVTRDQLAAINAIEEETTTSRGARGAAASVTRRNKFKLSDKQKALIELAKLARMYPAERTELTGADGGPIQTANLHAHKIDIESLEPAQRDQLRQVLLALKQKQIDSGSEDE